MLLSLRIENFALIDKLEIEFAPGLNVLTGETGAGKSIILDAIDIVLGGKVTSRLIRTGSKRAVVEANFRIDSSLIAWLSEQEIDLLDETDLICSREITNDTTRSTKGERSNLRSRSRVNGIVVNRRLMEQLRDRLVEITAQGQTVQLMSPAHQRGLLDLYGGSIILQQRDICASAYLTCQEAFQSLDKRRQSEQQRLQRLDWLEYQIHELTTANITDSEELIRLEQESQRLSHVVDLQQQSYRVYQALYQNDSGSPAGADLLGQAESLLSDMVQYDTNLQSILDLVIEARIQVVEASHQINTYGDSLETDPARLQEVEERIQALKQICRKYGPTLADAIAHYEKLCSELAELSGEGQSLEDLEKTYALCQETLTNYCTHLTQLRQGAAIELERQLIAQLKPLAMEKVQFQVALEPITPSATGADQVTFAFSGNPGEPLQPLAATASGGEMSRFLLALKACFSRIGNDRKTLIFDEIDAGVSGRVAGAIAERLHQLSQQDQVLCVTHQPLIAAMADRHFRVDKQAINPAFFALAHLNDEPILGFDEPPTDSEGSLERTVVRVSRLEQLSHRQEEIALLAGGESGEEAMTFAESLLNQAKLKGVGSRE